MCIMVLLRYNRDINFNITYILKIMFAAAVTITFILFYLTVVRATVTFLSEEKIV